MLTLFSIFQAEKILLPSCFYAMKPTTINHGEDEPYETHCDIKYHNDYVMQITSNELT